MHCLLRYASNTDCIHQLHSEKEISCRKKSLMAGTSQIYKAKVHAHSLATSKIHLIIYTPPYSPEEKLETRPLHGKKHCVWPQRDCMLLHSSEITWVYFLQPGLREQPCILKCFSTNALSLQTLAAHRRCLKNLQNENPHPVFSVFNWTGMSCSNSGIEIKTS